MARPLRLDFAGAVYHLTARGNARQAIYLDDADRRSFLGFLAREVEQQRWRCHAWCLMDNHYHLLIETPEPNLVRGMRRLDGAYAQAFNKRHDRVGHLFQGRYKSIHIDRDAYLLELCRYIVLNPVRAGLVKKPEAWRWSSYRATAGLAKPEPWHTTEWVLAQFGKTRHRAQAAYRRFTADGIGAGPPWDALRGQVYLGKEDFLERMQALAEDRPLDNVPLAQASPSRPTAEAIIKDVCSAFGLRESEIFARPRREAFRAAVYLLRRAANLPIKEIAVRAGVSPGRVSQIQRAIERCAASDTLGRLLKNYQLKN